MIDIRWKFIIIKNFVIYCVYLISDLFLILFYVVSGGVELWLMLFKWLIWFLCFLFYYELCVEYMYSIFIFCLYIIFLKVFVIILLNLFGILYVILNCYCKILLVIYVCILKDCNDRVEFFISFFLGIFLLMFW